MPKDQQNLKVLGQGNGNGNGSNGLQTEDNFKSDYTRPHLDERFITNIKGKDFVLYAGLLDLAHQMGLKTLKAKPIQLPNSDNNFEAICLATAETTEDKVFEDLGDCNPSNCHTMISKHLLRMASTRAKARVLRDMTNIGITCIDEISDPEEVIGEDIPKEPKRRTRRSKSDKESQKDMTSDPFSPSESNGNGSRSRENPTNNPGPGSHQTNTGGGGPKMSNAQKKAIENLARRKGISIEQLSQMTQERFNRSFEYLQSSEASSLIQELQQPA